MLDLYSIKTIESSETTMPSHICAFGSCGDLGSGVKMDFVRVHARHMSSLTYFSNTVPQNLRSLNPWIALAIQYGPVWTFSRKNKLSSIRNPHHAVVKCRL